MAISVWDKDTLIAASAPGTSTHAVLLDPVGSIFNFALGDLDKVYTFSTSSERTINLPTLTNDDIGTWITVVKLGTGKISIFAPAGATVSDSSDAGSVYNDNFSETYATITLLLATANKWVITGIDGSWVTN